MWRSALTGIIPRRTRQPDGLLLGRHARDLTDLAGDGGWVYSQYDEIHKLNYIGDTEFIRGEIVGTRSELGLNLVDVKVR